MNKDILYPLRRLHGLLIEAELRHEKNTYYKRLLNEKKKINPHVVFLALTPEHTNLGDHAIASEEIRLLRRLGIDYIEFTDEELITLRRQKLLGIMNKTPILITGGGNLGTLWPDVEMMMRDIVKSNPKSPVFIMPNTIFYEESEYGKEEFIKSQEVYNAHKKLAFFARERTSFKFMSRVYKNVKLIPDMVLFRNECTNDQIRMGCLLCLRNDLEKTITEEEKDILETQVRNIFCDDFSYTDTHAKKAVSIVQREFELSKKFSEFRSAELVITDRLHGMIFSAITGTPCIVINSKSPKVRGCYEWIKNLSYIRFVEDISQLETEFMTIPKGNHLYDNSHLQDYYAELEREIMSIV